jgi:IclR family acetate operon transcriptional repressor
VQSLTRALTLLNRIAEAPDGGISLTDLGHLVGLAPSTTHRLLTTLEQERYVRFDPEGRLWSIGVQAFVAGCAFMRTRALVTLARPHMRNLMEESGETVNLGVEDDGMVVYLSQVECRQVMRVIARPGSRVPMHCSAVGKGILSALPEKTRARFLHQHGMIPLTERTLITPASLGANLDHARAVGFAFDDEEHALGLRCISAPIFDETGDVIAAVSLSGPMARIQDDRVAPLAEMVMKAAGRISAQMGGFGGSAAATPSTHGSEQRRRQSVA